MESTTFGFIGLGLIGGSIAKTIKRIYKNSTTIIAYDINQTTLSSAKEEGVIDVLCTQIDEHFTSCDYIFLCAPVSINDNNLSLLKGFLSPDCILTDVGSVKSDIHETISAMNLESSFIGGHPMAGSEKTGYQNATDRLMENAYYILTPTTLVPKYKVTAYEELVLSLGSIPLILDYREHDYVAAAISHLPHIIAASLVNLVKHSDSKEGYMKMIAAGGFKDITRIASSSPHMWQQISLLNQRNIYSLLTDYIDSLNSVRNALLNQDSECLYQLFDVARDYRDSFLDASPGPLKKVYSIYIDIPDETGVIATISTLLSVHQISLKNIGIINNREFEEGVLRIEFYDEEPMTNAIAVLKKHNYLLCQKS